MTNNVDKLRIYEILAQLEAELESSPRAKFAGGNKRVVDLDRVYDLLSDMKVSIPDDMRRANRVIAEVDSIITDADTHAASVIQSAERRASMTIDKANAKSAQMIEDATTIFEQKTAEHPVYLEAQKRAQLLIRKAEYNATVVFDDAKRYSDQLLGDLLTCLNTYQAEITANRARLNVRATNTREEDITDEQQPETEQAAQTAAPVYEDEDDPAPEKHGIRGSVKSFFSNIASSFGLDNDEDDEEFES